MFEEEDMLLITAIYRIYDVDTMNLKEEID